MHCVNNEGAVYKETVNYIQRHCEVRFCADSIILDISVKVTSSTGDMKLTVLVVIFASEILGIFSIIVYDGTKESPNDQSSRRFGIQHAEQSQVSLQQALPSDGTLSGFSSVIVHRPPNEDHSGGGLTVKDPPKGWPLSEMHVSFNSHGNDENLKKSNEIKSSVPLKEHSQVQQRPHINQIEQQPFNKPQQESLFHKQQHLTKRQPEQAKVQQQQHPQELHRQLYQHQQQIQQQNVYQQQSRQQENLHQGQEKTEVEIHPQVIIKLPEQQTARLLRPLYVQDQSFSQQLPPSLNTQEKPFHPSVQISDNVNNEAMLTPVQYHGTHGSAFSPMAKKPFSGSTKVTDSTSQILSNNNNKGKSTYLTPGVNEEKFPRDNVKVVRMRHPHTTLGASYSVGFTTPADSFRNGNQLHNLIIKENVEHKGPVRHGKTLHRQKIPNGIEINNESNIHSKKPPPLQAPTYSISSEVLKNDNYHFIDDGRHQLVTSADGFTSEVNNQPSFINPISPGGHSPSLRFHHSPNAHVSSYLPFEEPQQVSNSALQYQKLLTRDLVPPPARTQVSPEGKPIGPSNLVFLPSRTAHPSTAFTSNKVTKFVSGGAINNGFSEPSNLHYIPESRNTVHQNYPSLSQPHYTVGYDSSNEKGNQGSATTGNVVSSGVPVSQNHAHRHPANSGGSSEFHGFSKSLPHYSTTQGHGHLIPAKLHFEHHTQQIVDATKHSATHTKTATSTQGIKNAFLTDHSHHSNNNPNNNIVKNQSQKDVENVFAGFKNGQFQGGYGGNIGYSFVGQDVRNTLSHTHHIPLGNNHGAGGAAAGQNILQFNKNTQQNIPGFLNLHNGALHLGHPAAAFLYPQQPFVQQPGGHVQTFYIPGAGTQHAVYTNNLVGAGGHPIGTPTLVTNIQPSAEAPVNQGQGIPTSAAATPVAPAAFSGAPLAYYRGQVINAAPQGNVEVSGSTFPQAQAAAFPGIGGAYPQGVHYPYNGGVGTTFVLSQAPLQDYSQQTHLQQVSPVGIPQYSNTFPAQINNVQTQSVGDIRSNSFGTKLTQQQHTSSQHGKTSSTPQKQQASNV